jgi:hypothetical protein
VKKIFLLVLLVLSLLTNRLEAQTVVTLAWDYDKVPTEVSTYVQAISIDGIVQTSVPTCIAKGLVGTTCSIPAPLLATGSHTVSISATKGSVTAQTIINGLGGASAPSNPTNHKVVITITITSGS